MDSNTDAYPPSLHPIDVLRFIGSNILSSTRPARGEPWIRGDVALDRLVRACILAVFVVIAFAFQGLVAIGVNMFSLPWGFGLNPLARNMDKFIFSFHAFNKDERVVLRPVGIFCHIAAVLIVVADYLFIPGEARWYALMAVSAMPVLMLVTITLLVCCTLYSSIRFSLPVMRLLKELP